MAIGTQTTYDIDVADVEYLRHGDKPLLATVFKPRGSGPFPIMVELHGGAWVRGARQNGNAANEALAKNGVIVAALDFRVPPVAPYPASLADIHYGIRWCKSQAQAWRGRPDRIGAMGTSSGAHPPCCSACARAIHATPRCPFLAAPPRTAPWAA
jgi:acetyl esterase